MGKFNTTVSMRTENHEGHVAYNMRPKDKLVTMVLTSFFNEKKFYGDNSTEMKKLIPEVIRQDPAFVANLAVFARKEFNMRSVSHVLVGFLANVNEGKPYVKRTVKEITLRGDDATEILAFYLSEFGKPIPNSLRRELKGVFTTFDAYTLAKYKGEGHAVKMLDILRLCRPKPTSDEQSLMWKQLNEGTLPTPYTWESELSAKGNNRETWERLIESGKVGYMALLRNLRNIVAANPSNMNVVLDRLSDPQAVRKSRQLPFRYLAAYKSLSGYAGSRVLNTLEKAVQYACDNVPRLPGRTVIAVDTSGSMSNRISYDSEIRCCEIGMMLGLIANRICDDAIFYTFDNYLNKKTVPANDILYASVNEAKASGGTRMELPFRNMIEEHVHADRVIIISDNECNSASYGNRPVGTLASQYRKETGNDIWVHAVDLMGYGTQQFAGPRTNIIAGWSEKVFDFILIAEQGEGSMEKKIEEYLQW